MAEKRITSVELHARLGAAIDRAVIEPVIVTKHRRDHLVMMSAERYAALLAASETRTASRPVLRPVVRKTRTA